MKVVALLFASVLSALAIVVHSPSVRAEDPSPHEYRVGLRTAVGVTPTELSKIDASFNDLEPDGISGPHHNSVVMLYRLYPFLEIGFGTLIGNSNYDSNRTTLSYQGGGLLIEGGHRLGPVSFFGGAHMGIVILHAMHHDNPEVDTPVRSGTFYKNGGFFFAPYAGFGGWYGNHELRVYAQPLMFGGGGYESANAFSAVHIGAGWSYAF